MLASVSPRNIIHFAKLELCCYFICRRIDWYYDPYCFNTMFAGCVNISLIVFQNILLFVIYTSKYQDIHYK